MYWVVKISEKTAWCVIWNQTKSVNQAETNFYTAFLYALVFLGQIRHNESKNKNA